MSGLKLRALARFPANVTAVGGIKVIKESGEWTISPDFASLDAIVASNISDPTLKEIWIWDPLEDEYNVLTLAGLGDALYKATSTTSLAIGTGSKVFVTQSGKDFGIGSWVIATSDADPTDFMLGQITAYVTTSLTVNVSTVGGSGTNADWTIRASAAAGSAGRSAGYLYGWSTDTTATDPTTGKVKVNNAALASATAVYISETDADSSDLSAEIATWDDGTSTIRGRLKIYNQTAPGTFAVYDVTGSNTDNGAWDTVNVSYVTGAGSFTGSDSLRIQYIAKGDKGDTGASGSSGAAGTDGVNAGIKWLFDSSTSMADPGSGDIRLNNAALASVTAAAVSANSADSGNPSVLAYLQAWDDSTTTGHRGYLIIRKISAPQNFAIYDITDTLTDNTTWVQLVLTYVIANGSFSNADPLIVSFHRTGDKGTDGAGSGDVTAALNFGTDNVVVRADGTVKGVQSTGVSVDDSNNMSGVAALSTTTIELGHASDTTLARSGAGAVTIEGNVIYRAGGTDVPVADGGTGSSTAADARTALGVPHGKQSVWVPAGAMTPRTTNGAALNTTEMSSNKNMVKTLDFDTTTQEFAQFDIRMPKSWDESTVNFIPVWSHAATTTNFGVVWGLDAVAVSDDDTLDVAFGTAQTSTDTGGTTNDSYQGPESSAITIAGTPAAGDLVMYRIHRDVSNGSDTMAIDARLHGVLLLYTNDTTSDT
jgi:hypothetical protein